MFKVFLVTWVLTASTFSFAASRTEQKTMPAVSKALVNQLHNFINRFLAISAEFDSLSTEEKQQIQTLRNLKLQTQVNLTQKELHQYLQIADMIAIKRQHFVRWN